MATNGLMKCEGCGTDLGPTAIYCETCGKSTPVDAAASSWLMLAACITTIAVMSSPIWLPGISFGISAFVGVLIVFAFFIPVAYRSQLEAKRRFEAWQKLLRSSKEKYQTSLECLTKDPGNAQLKQESLKLGRVYAELSRSQPNFRYLDGSVTVYDELAIKNDLDAACAGAAMTH